MIDLNDSDIPKEAKKSSSRKQLRVVLLSIAFILVGVPLGFVLKFIVMFFITMYQDVPTLFWTLTGFLGFCLGMKIIGSIFE